MKCQTCRVKDVELLTKWERVRDWLFIRLNSTFFPTDFNDLKADRYTQGFSDGTIDGVKSEQRRLEKMKLLYPDTKLSDNEMANLVQDKINSMYSNVDLSKIVTLTKQGLVYIGGVKAEVGELTNLQSEAKFLEQSTIWKLLIETPSELARKAMFQDDGKIETQLLKGRAILYTLSAQKNLLNVLKSYASPDKKEKVVAPQSVGMV